MSEWGLLEPLYAELKKRYGIMVNLAVTGAHLNSEHGMTVDVIEKSYIINHKVESLLGTYTENGTCLSIGLGISGFSRLFAREWFDLVILLGDRFEIFAAAITAYIHRIPIAHLHGGELTIGSIDDGFRHSITKMSALHFVAAEEYHNRVIQLGEQPDTVFNVGALGTQGLKLYTGERKGVIVIYHPVENEAMSDLLTALGEVKGEDTYYITPNADAGRYEATKGLLVVTDGRCTSYTSYPRPQFIELLSKARFIIGNSSAGIIEAPALGTPTINIGRRQEGRLRASSVLDCDNTEGAITEAIWAVDKIVPDPCPPYGRGGDVATKIVDIIEANESKIKKRERKVFYEKHI